MPSSQTHSSRTGSNGGATPSSCTFATHSTQPILTQWLFSLTSMVFSHSLVTHPALTSLTKPLLLSHHSNTFPLPPCTVSFLVSWPYSICDIHPLSPQMLAYSTHFFSSMAGALSFSKRFQSPTRDPVTAYLRM